MGGPCRWNCPSSDPDCHGRDRQNARNRDKWVDWLARVQPLSARVPWMTTPGNHDNDLEWFFVFRPPVPSSLPGVSASENSIAGEAQATALRKRLLGTADAAQQQGMVNDV